MYNQPFYIPGYTNMLRGGMMGLNRAGVGAAARGGLFGRLGNTMGALKAINWGNIINNTSKTLGVVNQTIPLVKQVGPMIGNMRSMLKVVSLFKDETDVNDKKDINTTKSKKNITSKNNTSNINSKTDYSKTTNIQNNESDYLTRNNYYSPTFFID